MVDYSWLILTQQLSPEECDRDWGGVKDQWETLEAQMVEGDEVWRYECCLNRQHPLSGTSGVCVRRAGQIIDHVVTRYILE